MLADLFSSLTGIITGLIGSMIEAFNGVTDLFYNSVDGEFTVIGSLLLIGFGLFFVMFAWRVIQGLIKK